MYGVIIEKGPQFPSAILKLKDKYPLPFVDKSFRQGYNICDYSVFLCIKDVYL